MLVDKLLPSFFILEFSGDVCSAVIPGDLGIANIAISSKNYNSDLEAIAALERIETYLKGSSAKPLDTQVDFNPEFFPTIKLPDPTEEQLAERAKLAQLVENIEAELPAGQHFIAMTHDFDEAGDFVMLRRTSESDVAKIRGRVAIDPELYASEKQQVLKELNPEVGAAKKPQPTVVH